MTRLAHWMFRWSLPKHIRREYDLVCSDVQAVERLKPIGNGEYKHRKCTASLIRRGTSLDQHQIILFIEMAVERYCK